MAKIIKAWPDPVGLPDPFGAALTGDAVKDWKDAGGGANGIDQGHVTSANEERRHHQRQPPHRLTTATSLMIARCLL